MLLVDYSLLLINLLADYSYCFPFWSMPALLLATRRAGARKDLSETNPTKKVSCFFHLGTKITHPGVQEVMRWGWRKRELGRSGKQKLLLLRHSSVCVLDCTGHSAKPPPPGMKALVKKGAGRDMLLKKVELNSLQRCLFQNSMATLLKSSSFFPPSRRFSGISWGPHFSVWILLTARVNPIDISERQMREKEGTEEPNNLSDMG